MIRRRPSRPDEPEVIVSAVAAAVATISAAVKAPGSTLPMSLMQVAGLLALTTVALPTSALFAQATTTISYHRRNTVTRVESTIETAHCAVAAGAFKVAIRVREDGGEVKSLEFNETWHRSNAKSVEVEADYPIGENVELG